MLVATFPVEELIRRLPPVVLSPFAIVNGWNPEMIGIQLTCHKQPIDLFRNQRPERNLVDLHLAYDLIMNLLCVTTSVYFKTLSGRRLNL
jgi:hypothetical protein